MECAIHEERRLSFFEKYLTLWVIGCIGIGILLGKLFSEFAVTLGNRKKTAMSKEAINYKNSPKKVYIRTFG